MSWIKTKVDPNFILAKVGDLLYNGGKRTAETDELGVELELEGENLATAYDKLKLSGCADWTMKNDGSLDLTGKEFTFNRALNRNDAKKAINNFYEVFDKEAQVKTSSRCSTHMHLNFQHMTMLQVYSFLTLFYTLEMPFFNRFAPERITNEYCRPLSHSGVTVNKYSSILKKGAQSGTNRYQAVNMESLMEHGSLECRMLGGADNKEKPLEWMDILLELYDYIKNNPRLTPAEILCKDDISEFVAESLPKAWQAIKDVKDVNKLIEFGRDTCQDFAFAVDWSPAKTADPPKKARKVNPYKVSNSAEEPYPLFDPTPEEVF